MRIFKGRLESLAFLSCCSYTDDPNSPRYPDSPKLDYKPPLLATPINFKGEIANARSTENLSRPSTSKTCGRDKLNRSIVLVSRSSSQNSHVRKRYPDSLHTPRHIPPTPIIPPRHPWRVDDTLTQTTTVKSPTDSISSATTITTVSIPSSQAEFKPLDLPSILADSEQTFSVPLITNEEEKPQEETLLYKPPQTQPLRRQTNPENPCSMPTESPSESDNLARLKLDSSNNVRSHRPMFSTSDCSRNSGGDLSYLTHMRSHSDYETVKRLKLALKERSRLDERLKSIEKDIARNTLIFATPPGSRTGPRDDLFSDDSGTFPLHKLQSSPSDSAVQRERSGFLNSKDYQPDGRNLIPPIPDISRLSTPQSNKIALPHPLKSSPSNLSLRPISRSWSLTSEKYQPDLMNPMPPLPDMPKHSYSENGKSILPHPLRSSPSNSSLVTTGRSSSITSSKFRPDHGSPTPPLPVVLNHPSQKNKGVSRISSWLSITSGHDYNAHGNFLTVDPKPVTNSDDFYQCPKQPDSRTESSFSSSEDLSDQPSLRSLHGNSPAIQSELSGFEETDNYQIACPNVENAAKFSEPIPDDKSDKPYFLQNEYFGIAF